MNENLAYQEEPWEEKLNGEIILMSPLPTVNHNWVAGRIFVAFSVCLKGKSCIPFGDGTDVYLTESDHVIPDVMIICKRDNQVQGRFRRAGLDCRSIVPWNKETG